jgi:hypothetical protein
MLDIILGIFTAYLGVLGIFAVLELIGLPLEYGSRGWDADERLVARFGQPGDLEALDRYVMPAPAEPEPSSPFAEDTSMLEIFEAIRHGATNTAFMAADPAARPGRYP